MRRLVGRAVGLLGAALVCAGCASPPDLAAERAQVLQGSVLAVTKAASEARWGDAQELLAQTRSALDSGADEGEVSTTRYREIDAALDRVATELAAAQAVADQLAAEQAAAEQAAAEQAAAEQAAADAAAAEAAEQQRGPAAPADGPATKKGKGPGKPGK